MATPKQKLRIQQQRANALIGSGKLSAARELYASLCRKHQSNAEAWLALANLNRRLSSYPEAEACARHVLSFQPANHLALVEYGVSIQCQGRTDEAIAAYKSALSVHPGCGEAHSFLAAIYLERGLHDLSIDHYYKAIEISPNYIEALNNLSALLTNSGNIKESLNLLEHALKLQPEAYQMLTNMARAHLFSGNAAKAASILARLHAIYPDDAVAHSKYLLCINYLPGIDADRMLHEHTRWSAIHTKHLTRYEHHDNTPDPSRKIHIGYISPDLKTHPVSAFIEPILANHDKTRFTITCYADVANPDETSRRLQTYCDNWKFTTGLSDAKLAEESRLDGIDILVDLTGHTANNRLLTFARKPAPIQVTYLGYPNTTGLRQIDYRLTDSLAECQGTAEKCYTEQLVYLPDCFLCYSPPANSPPVIKASKAASKEIVFGSFNNLAKITPQVIRVWSTILSGIEGSTLLLKSMATSDSFVLQRLTELFDKHGITDDRLLFRGFSKDTYEHLDTYNVVDIALDTFPYNGTTTTCESLWMGVPVITSVGTMHAGRVSYSILSQLGLGSLAADNPEHYIELATDLANDHNRLAELHSGLRDTMKSSRLCDAGVFCRNLESSYSKMWEKYCSGGTELD
jgi:predicted O-linked N-acetylglucosamine transferase (SPINDLY family)